MYPYLDIFGTQIHMTGLGFIIFVIVFLLGTKRYAKRFDLDRASFWRRVPIYLLIIYVISSYMWYLIEDFVFFPLNIKQILLYISPDQYNFHLVGILIAVAGCARHFLQKVTDKHNHIKWIDTWFLAFSLACIPLGLFLLLGDTFIGEPTSSSIHVTTLHPDSRMAAYGQVLPLGLGISLLGLVSFLGFKIRRTKNPRVRGYGLIGWIVLLIALCVIILFQEYPRHLVLGLLGKTWDIKNYTLLVAAALIRWKYKTVYKFFVNLN